MKVSGAVQELEAQFETMRARAERAEGMLCTYEARERARSVSKAVTDDGEWTIHWRNGDEAPVEFSFSPALWILGVAEGWAKHPHSFELRVSPTQQQLNDSGDHHA